MTEAVQKTDPDVLHTQGLWTYASIAAYGTAQQAGVPYIVTPRGMLDPWAIRNSGWKKKIADWVFERKHLHHAACLHALCASEADSIRAYGLSNPICVIPNGVNLPRYSETQSTVLWPGHMEADSKVLLFLGRIHPKKGLQHLIEAWSALTLRGWHLVIVGWDDGGHEPELRRLVRRYGLESSVHFMGPLYGPEKEEALSRADAFVLPSHSEGLPMAVLEAWSYQLPVLMTPQCNIPEGFEADAAIRIRPHADAVRRGVQQLADMSATERAHMGKRGRALVADKFTWSRVAEQMHSVYQWVLGDGPKPSYVRCI
jgi:poly(glycerol-phosphate) alpha-glucosyltransferase